MTQVTPTSTEEEGGAGPEALLQLINGYPLAQVIHVAAQLRLADVLADGPQRIEDLADATGTHAPSLGRLLRRLAALEVVTEEADGRFGLTPLGGLLRSGIPGSIRARVLFLTGE